MHPALIGQPGSTDAGPLVAADSLASLNDASADMQAATRASSDTTSFAGRTPDGMPLASPLSQPPRHHAPVLTLDSPLSAARRMMHCDSVERSRLTQEGQLLTQQGSEHPVRRARRQASPHTLRCPRDAA